MRALLRASLNIIKRKEMSYRSNKCRINITQSQSFYSLTSMDSVDIFPHHLPIHHSTTLPTLRLPHRSLSPKEEKEALIRKIQALMVQNNALEEKQSNLHGAIYDLRKLLNVVGKESSEEVEYIHRQNQELKKKVGRLSNGLKYAYESGKHLQKCAQYWGQFLQQ